MAGSVSGGGDGRAWCQVVGCEVRWSKVVGAEVTWGEVRWLVARCHVTSSHVMSHVMWWYAMPCDVMSSDVKSPARLRGQSPGLKLRRRQHDRWRRRIYQPASLRSTRPASTRQSSPSPPLRLGFGLAPLHIRSRRYRNGFAWWLLRKTVLYHKLTAGKRRAEKKKGDARQWDGMLCVCLWCDVVGCEVMLCDGKRLCARIYSKRRCCNNRGPMSQYYYHDSVPAKCDSILLRTTPY